MLCTRFHTRFYTRYTSTSGRNVATIPAVPTLTHWFMQSHNDRSQFYTRYTSKQALQIVPGFPVVRTCGRCLGQEDQGEAVLLRPLVRNVRCSEDVDRIRQSAMTPTGVEHRRMPGPDSALGCAWALHATVAPSPPQSWLCQ